MFANTAMPRCVVSVDALWKNEKHLKILTKHLNSIPLDSPSPPQYLVLGLLPPCLLKFSTLYLAQAF